MPKGTKALNTDGRCNARETSGLSLTISPIPFPDISPLTPIPFFCCRMPITLWGHLQGLGRLIPEPDLLVGPFLTREALASSRIEGTNASLTEVLRAEEVGAERSDDVAEVERYLAATRRGLKLIETLPISLRLLKEVHITLMEGVRGEEKQPGEIRWSPVTDRAERKLLQRKFDGPVSGERPHTTDISKPIHHRPSRPDYRWRNRAGRAQPAGPCRRIWLARIYGRSG